MHEAERIPQAAGGGPGAFGAGETADVLRDQRELIADAVAQGQTGKKAVARMGDPEALAQELAGAPRQMEPEASLGRRLAAYALDTLPVVLAALMGLLLFQAGGVTGISTLTGGVDAPGEAARSWNRSWNMTGMAGNKRNDPYGGWRDHLPAALSGKRAKRTKRWLIGA